MISGETERLELLRRILAVADRPPESRVVFGVDAMDDGALLLPKRDESIVVASDFVRGSGFYLFELGLLNYFDIGYYLIVANVSDIAAMGARPFAATTILRYSERMTDVEFADTVRGMRAAADAYSVEIIGGDIGGYGMDVLAATVLGAAEPGKTLRRTGASVGDRLCVTGTIGRPIAALTYFKKGKPFGVTIADIQESELLAAWRRPVARVAEGVLLASSGEVTSCQDVSDGLKATVDQMGRASGISFRLNADTLPIHSAVLAVAREMRTDAISLAMSASVDFELLFTVRAEAVDRVLSLLGHHGLIAREIGEAVDEPTNSLAFSDGSIQMLPGVAWNQQTGDYLDEILRRERTA